MPNSPSQSMAIVSQVADNGRRKSVIKIVEAWHNETHPGGFRFCDQQPCHAVNWAPCGVDVPG